MHDPYSTSSMLESDMMISLCWPVCNGVAPAGKPLPLTSHTLAPVPVYIGGKGLPDNVVMRDDLPTAGLANITATYINLLGFEAPELYQPSLITTA